MIRYTSLRKYKRHLLKELGPVNEKTRSSALDDAEEHLDLLVKDIMKKNRKIGKRSAFNLAVESFGSPSEFAEAYKIFS